jgi:hypothetical protein
MVRFRVQAINDLPKFIGRYAAEQLQFFFFGARIFRLRQYINVEDLNNPLISKREGAFIREGIL